MQIEVPPAPLSTSGRPSVPQHSFPFPFSAWIRATHQSAVILSWKLLVKGFRAVWVTSSNVICSSFLCNTHHKAPAESHAQLNAECTIWAVSKPREAKAFNKQHGKHDWRTGRQQRYKIYVAGKGLAMESVFYRGWVIPSPT